MNTNLKIHPLMYELLQTQRFTGLPVKMQLYSGDTPVLEPVFMFGQTDGERVGFYNTDSDIDWTATETVVVTHMTMSRAVDDEPLIVWKVTGSTEVTTGSSVTVPIPQMTYGLR